MPQGTSRNAWRHSDCPHLGSGGGPAGIRRMEDRKGTEHHSE